MLRVFNKEAQNLIKELISYKILVPCLFPLIYSSLFPFVRGMSIYNYFRCFILFKNFSIIPPVTKMYAKGRLELFRIIMK